MNTYQYKGYDSSGSVQRGLIEALEPKAARQKLLAQGIHPESVDPIGHGVRTTSRWRPGFSSDLRGVFYRELAALLSAGFPVVGAIELLLENPELRTVHDILARVRDELRAGRTLSGSLGQASEAVSPFEEAVLDVGERTASLSTVLDRLADYLEEQGAVRERIISALIYPAVVVAFLIPVVVFMLGWVLPGFIDILLEGGQSLPALTRGVQAFGWVVIYGGVPLLLIMGVAGILARRKIARDPAFAIAVDRVCFRLPIVGAVYTQLVNMRFSRTLAILLEGGVALVDGLVYAARATGSAWISDLMNESQKSVVDGASLSDSLRRVPPLSSVLPGWVQAGEASGSLAALLEHASLRFQRQWERAMNRLVALVEPTLIIVVGVFVLLVMLAILLPVMQFRDAMAGGF